MAQLDAQTFEDLYEHAPCGYLTLDLDGRIDRVNRTFLSWIGHDATELIGRKFQSLLTVAGKIYFETHFAPLLQLQGFFNEVAFDLVDKSNIQIPVLINALKRPDVTNTGAVLRMTIFNATDRRKYERELLAARNAVEAANDELRIVNEKLSATNQKLDQANQQLQAFYDTLPVGIFRANGVGRMVQSNQEFCNLFGIDAAEDWLESLSGSDRNAISTEWHNAVREVSRFSKRLQIIKDGEIPLHIEIKAVPVGGNDRDKRAFVGFVEDVSEQVRMEFQRRQIERDAAVKQLTGGVAHNLNNILAVIMGNLELIEDDLADRSTLRPILQNGLAASERAAALVSRLLVYSGQGFARPAVIGIDTCLQGIVTDLTMQIGEAHRLSCDLDALDAKAHIDPAMLTEAIGELVTNAVFALPKGGEIRLSTRLAGGGNIPQAQAIVIQISDAGVGMDEATIAKAREPFFTTREVGKGMGLGLSLVDGIARIAGGELKLFSAAGQGTKAELWLPIQSD